ncbi:MAG: Flp pilus assembly complex ATPase component TadA, partial [Phascolarctobacterium sp.]|nr:Flp pilus assembly complex ATPase component TadA [Phascolarctobacterium sp.]
GHLVFSTLHTNNAIGAVTRLLDIGIEPFLLAAALRGVVAQRLVRTICPYCDGGCEHCNYTGYKGRIAVQEVLQITSKLQNLITHGVEEGVLLETARESGFTTIQEDCLAKVQAGLTTMEEYYRVASGVV